MSTLLLDIKGGSSNQFTSDVHPWEIKINGEQWPGKIRLIGFVDVFFLFSYSANARFEKGIIFYSMTW